MKKSLLLFSTLIVAILGFAQFPTKTEAKTSVSVHRVSVARTVYKAPKIVHVPTTKPVAVKGYVKKSGTVVKPYMKTTPNKTKTDNYSTKGNLNPFTGKVGTKK